MNSMMSIVNSNIGRMFLHSLPFPMSYHIFTKQKYYGCNAFNKIYLIIAKGINVKRKRQRNKRK